ncbi:hypothetical protein D3C71_1670880 [compost metagenome]
MRWEFYSRMTDRVSFITRDIVRYDKATATYHVADRLSEELETHIRKALGDDAIEFDKFTMTEWGPRKDSSGNIIKGEVEESMLNYYKTNSPNKNTDVYSDMQDVETVPTDSVFSDIVELFKEEEEVIRQAYEVTEDEDTVDTVALEEEDFKFNFFDGVARL